MRKKIALIGAGQIGSRHLQALALLDQPTDIYVIDPSEKIRQVAQERLKEIEGHNKHFVSYLSDLKNANLKIIDLAIVATNSRVRSDVVLELITNTKVKYLILEKFLFQRLNDYLEIEKQLIQSRTTTFVNCPRRMFPGYVQIKNVIKQNSQFRMEVIGNIWGLGCNGIHFIDLFQWLSGEPITKWSNEMYPGFMESKRKGYVEFNGSVNGKSKNGCALNLTSFKNGTPNISVRISTPSERFVVAETYGKAWHETINEHNINLYEFDFSVIHQSHLTNKVALQLFEKGKCDLTPFSDSVKTHMPYLEMMLEHFNNNKTIKTDTCPIT